MKKTLLVICALLLLLVFAPACGDEDDPSTGSGQADDDDYDDDDDDDDVDDDDTSDDDDDADPGPQFRAGFSKVDVTPHTRQKMAGYGPYFVTELICRWSRGTHDPLYAHATALEDAAGDAVILIVMDNIGTITNEVVEIQAGIAEATGLSEENILVASTHTHHGPDTIGMWGLLIPPRSGRDEEYLDEMVVGAVQAGIDAWEARVPAYLEYAAGQEPTFHFNQNTKDPNRALDSTMTVLAAYDENDELIGSMMNWASHPTVQDYKNRLFSSDFAGVFYRVMDETLGGTNMFVNGAIAAIQPYDPDTGGLFGSPRAWDDVEMVGGQLVNTAQDLMTDATPIEDPDIWLLETSEVSVLLENFLFWLAGVFDVIPREVPNLHEYGTTYMTTFALGPVTFGTVPGEYIPDYSFELRQIMGGDAQFVIGLGMDWIGYAITPEQHGMIAYAYEWLLCPSSQAGEELMGVYREIYDDL